MQLMLFVYGLAALVVLQLTRSLVARVQYARKEKALGCAPPPTFPGGFLGIPALREIMAADKAWRLMPYFMARYNRMSEMLGRPANMWRFHILGSEVLFTTDPENIKTILATKFDDFGLGLRRPNMMAFLGDGIFVQDGKAWEHSRAMLRPNFVRDQVADLELEERHIQHFMRVMPVNADGWTADINLQTLFFRLTLDSATEFLFGESVDSQIAHLPGTTRSTSERTDEKLFAFSFDDGQRHLAKRFRLQDKYWLHNPKQFREDTKNANAFVDHFVESALQATAPGRDQKTAEEGRKTKYIVAHSLAEQTRDPTELRSQLLNILLAGRDTTASLLSFLFQHLVRNPALYTELRTAIVHDFGTYDSPKTSNLTFAGLKNCATLQSFLNETLRLTTVVPGNGRTAVKDTTLPRGGGPDGRSPVFVKKGQLVEYSIHVLHRRKDIWGPDAEEFKPERWSRKNAGRISTTGPSTQGWEYLPFNGGPRICIGQQFALTEAAYVVVRLVQRFETIAMGTGEDDKDWETKWNVTLTAAPGRGPIVRLKEARN